MALSPADILALSRLLDQGMALGAGEHEAWLSALPAEDQHLLPQLREMLAAHNTPDSDGRFATLPKLVAEGATAYADERVGAYRLIREIGCGGMGSVWLAERADGSYQRKVALKLPRLAWDASLTERMARERDIGALLEHPAIARLYDAGVDEHGRPFLAFEYIDGQPIDAWCESRALDVRGRLQLFLQVVRAVAYAHGRLVVHRDIKPSNVLVTPDGQARLLDFGIAKLLTEAAPGTPGLTQEQGRVMTPTYASPEQIAGEAITVQSDVYSLGVLLYELLTGSVPYAAKRDTRGAVEDAILNGDAPLASSRVKEKAVARALRGEVDAILCKAMQRETSRRYATADALAEDIERHLKGEAVAARPDSWAYRMRKALRRHWIGVASTTVVLVTIVVGLGSTLQQAQRAAREADRARVATEFVSEIFRINAAQDPARVEAGASASQTFLDRGARLIKTRFEAQPEVQAHLYGVVGRIYADMGAGVLAVDYANQQIQALERLPSDRAGRVRALLLLADGLRALDRDAEAEVQAQRAVDAARSDNQLEANAYAALASLQQNNGKIDDAKLSVQAAERALGTGGEQGVANTNVLMVRAALLQAEMRFDEALPLMKRALDTALNAEGPKSLYAAKIRNRIAKSLLFRRRDAESRVFMDAALAGMRSTGPAGEILAAVAAADHWSSGYGQARFSYAEASAVMDQSRAIAARSIAVPPIVRAKIDLSAAQMHLDWGNVAAAQPLIQSSAGLIKTGTSNLALRAKVLLVESRLAMITGRHDDADVLLRELRTLNARQGIGLNAWSSWDWALIALNLGMQGKNAAAESELNSAPQFKVDHSFGAISSYSERVIPEARARIRLDHGDLAGALSAMPSLEGLTPSERAQVPQERALHGELLCASGNAGQGWKLMQEALDAMAKVAGEMDYDVARSRALGGLCALRAGDREQAKRLAALARRAFVIQPGVSGYYKAPLVKLEAALGCCGR